MADTVIPLKRTTRTPPTGRTCVCGATWRPGFSSDPAWLLTADPELNFFAGLLSCHCCGRKKLDVIRELAERRRAEQAPAIPVRERKPASIIELRPST